MGREKSDEEGFLSRCLFNIPMQSSLSRAKVNTKKKKWGEKNLKHPEEGLLSRCLFNIPMQSPLTAIVSSCFSDLTYHDDKIINQAQKLQHVGSSSAS